MANNLEIQKLTPSEVTRIFSGMSPLKATRYYNKIMTNPATPKANLELVRQYREQNEQRFLSDAQMKYLVIGGCMSDTPNILAVTIDARTRINRIAVTFRHVSVPDPRKMA